MKKYKFVQLKDGFQVEKRTRTLNVNKDRHYVLYENDKRIASNLTYKDVFWILKFLREDIKH